MKNLLCIVALVLVAACSTKTVTTRPDPVIIESPQVQSHFVSKTSLKGINLAISLADRVINLKDFKEEVKSIESFDMSSENGEDVIRRLSSLSSVNVSTYVTSWFSPWKCNVLAHRNGSTIKINTRKCVYPRATDKIVNTLVHEALHVVGYGHGGDNDPSGKENTVNYKVGDIAQKYAKKLMENQ